MRRNTIFFNLGWPEGIVSIPVGRPFDLLEGLDAFIFSLSPTQSDQYRISLTLTQTPLPQLTAWSQFMAGAWS